MSRLRKYVASVDVTVKEGPIHPIKNHRATVVRVDNGIGHLDLMPKTAIRGVV